MPSLYLLGRPPREAGRPEACSQAQQESDDRLVVRYSREASDQMTVEGHTFPANAKNSEIEFRVTRLFFDRSVDRQNAFGGPQRES